MNKKHLLPVIAVAFGGAFASAQDAYEVTETSVSVTEVPSCDIKYYNNWRDGWFLQVGGGVNIPVQEGFKDNKKKVGADYTLGFGRWFSPFFAFRFTGTYGNVRENLAPGIMNYRSVQVFGDVMWDMCNSIGGVNLNRPVSVVPYVGIGGVYNYRFRGYTGAENAYNDGHIKNNVFGVSVNAGLQLRFRLCRYVDFFLEGRATFSGDNYNNIVHGLPVDIAFQGTGGFTFNIGGKSFQTYDPCAYQAYIADLNGQVNDLRAELAGTAAALAAAESQLPCPEVVAVETAAAAPAPAPMMSTVRFTINSSKITKLEEVNVYNVAEYLKANPEVNVVITGYADKDTGTSEYNQGLSQRRAQSVYDMLIKTYGIDASRLTIKADGSAVQPYTTNDWNRIVIFTQE